MTDEHRIYGREAIPDLARRLNAIDTCLFASRGATGALHARPMSNNGEVEWDGTSWFFAPSGGRLVAEVKADPSAVTTYKAEEGFTYVSISGRVSVETDDELKRRYWLPELDRWFPNGPEDPGVTLLRLQAEHADWWTEQGDGSADLRETAAPTL